MGAWALALQRKTRSLHNRRKRKNAVRNCTANRTVGSKGCCECCNRMAWRSRTRPAHTNLTPLADGQGPHCLRAIRPPTVSEDGGGGEPIVAVLRAGHRVPP